MVVISESSPGGRPQFMDKLSLSLEVSLCMSVEVLENGSLLAEECQILVKFVLPP
jgi:hypothetical protein